MASQLDIHGYYAEQSFEMLPFKKLSVDLDTASEEVVRTCPLIYIEPPPETNSMAHESTNAEVLPETTIINYLAVDHEFLSESVVRRRRSISFETSLKLSADVNSLSCPEASAESFSRTRDSINLEVSLEPFGPQSLLINSEPRSKAFSFTHAPMNSQVLSETKANSHSSINLDVSPESFVRPRSSSNIEVSPESFVRPRTSSNIEVPSASKSSPTHTEPPMKLFSSDHPTLKSDMPFETIRNSHTTINDEATSKSSTRKYSSIDYEGLSELFKCKRSSLNIGSEPDIVSGKTPSIYSEKAIELKKKDKDEDAIFMQQMGYTQELNRGFSGLMSFTFCFTVVSVFPSISIGLDFGLNTGGSGVIIWSWIIGSFFNILVGLSLSEICSTYPNSGSVYYWSGQLAPIKYAPLASYACGWLNYFGNVGGTAAFASGFASILNAAVALQNGGGNSTFGLNDVPHPTSIDNKIQAAIAIGVAILWTMQNMLKINHQGWLNNLAAFIQTGSTIAITVTILVLAKVRTSPYDVFFSTNNSTGFSFPYVCCIGILPTLFSFSGFESAGHLTEETRNADRKAPLAITGTCISAAFIGFVYILSLLFASGNPIDLIQGQTNPSATVQIYQTSTPFPVTLLFTILLLLCLYFAGVSATTVSSRTGYALARDSLFPYSKFLTIIYEPTQAPMTSVLLVGLINILLLLLQLFSTTAFAAIVSISTIGFQLSYIIPILFRCTVARKRFRKGRFNLGKFGVPIGMLSITWLFVTSVILLFPFVRPITAGNMNWTIVVFSVITIFAALYWIFEVGKWYTGPPRMADVDKTSPHDHI